MKLGELRIIRPATEADLAAEHGVPYSAAKQRITAYGWDPISAATTPVNTKFRRKSA